MCLFSHRQEFKQAYALPSTQTWPSVPMNEVDFLGYIQTSLISAREFIDLEIRAQSAAGKSEAESRSQLLVWPSFCFKYMEVN